MFADTAVLTSHYKKKRHTAKSNLSVCFFKRRKYLADFIAVNTYVQCCKTLICK